MTKVDLSVIVTCYNKEKYLEEAINSVLQNTWQPKEIILVHDGCKDPAYYSNCLTLIPDYNNGVAKSRQLGVKNSSGHFLLFLDGDDKLPPDYIEKAIKADSDIAYTDILSWFNHPDYTGPNGNILYEVPKKLTIEKMWHHCQIIVSSVVTRKVYDEIGGFKELPMFEDWDFWLRAMARGYKFKKFNSLFYYRQTPGTRNQGAKEERRKYFNRVKSNFIFTKGGKGKKSTLKELTIYDKIKGQES